MCELSFTGCEYALTAFSCPTLAGQGVVADDGDSEALAVILG